MSRLQLALNVADLDEAVDVLLHPLRHRARQAPARLRQLRGRRPAAQAGALRQPRGDRHPQPPRHRARVDGGGRGAGRAPRGRRARPRRGGRRRVLLRPAGQALGTGPDGQRWENYVVLADAQPELEGDRDDPSAHGCRTCARRLRPGSDAGCSWPTGVPRDPPRAARPAELHRHRAAGHRRGRLRHRRPAALPRRRRPAAAGELHRHRHSASPCSSWCSARSPARTSTRSCPLADWFLGRRARQRPSRPGHRRLRRRPGRRCGPRRRARQPHVSGSRGAPLVHHGPPGAGTAGSARWSRPPASSR